MRISDKKRSELYEAISEPIMQQRIDIQKHGSEDIKHLDGMLFHLTDEIWREVHKVLNLDGPA